jgi:hypothetical protein
MPGRVRSRELDPLFIMPRLPCRWSFTLSLACLALVVCPPPGRQVAAADEANEEPTQDFSPLHDLLGIDPKTGQFKPQQPVGDARGKADQDRAHPPATTARSAPEPNRAGRAADSEEANRAVEDFSDRLRRISERGDGGLDQLTGLLRDELTDERLAKWNRIIAWSTAALLMLYPLGIIFSEAAAYFWPWGAETWTDADRRYARRRFWGRMAQAAIIAGLIVLATLATLTIAWWSDPAKLAVLAAAAVVLGLAASTLSSLVKQSAAERTLAVMREVRLEQMELRKDMDELRRRLRQVTIREG